jgi:PAS domain S-box-containing protein
MPVQLWGATEAPRLLMPQRPVLALLLLLIYGLALGWLFYQQRPVLSRLSRRQGVVLGALSLAAAISVHLYVISVTFPGLLPRPGVAQNPQTVLALVAAIPLVFAAAYLPAPLALLAGLAAGLSRALWQSHQVFDLLYFSLATALMATLLQQRYRGRMYALLRDPLVASLLGLTLPFPLLGLAAITYASSSVDALVALDWGLSMTWAHLLPLALEALIAGFVLRAVWLVAELRPERGSLVSSIAGRSLRTRLLANFLVLAIVVGSLLVMIVFLSARSVATRLSVNQMAHDANVVAEQIPGFRNQLQNLLRQYGDNPALLSADEEVAEEQLAQLVRSAGAYYRRVILVGDSGRVRAYYPNRDVTSMQLTALEEEAVAGALSRGLPSITPAQQTPGGSEVISIVVPVRNGAGEPEASLVARIPSAALGGLVSGMQGTLDAGTGFIVDELNRVVAHPSETSLLTSWTPGASEQQHIRARRDLPGFAYEGRSSDTNARELVYVVEGPDHPWTVVLTLPYTVVLRLALDISMPLLLALLPIFALVGTQVYFLSSSITTPLQRLVQASQQLTSGNWDVAVPVEDEGEVGQLGQAFERMRRAMQQRFTEDRLLLQVSQDISTSIDIEHGIPSVLRGILRGTGAAGARAVILNRAARHPLTFAEGPVGQAMARFDRQIAGLVQGQEEVVLGTPEEIRERLELETEAEMPVQAIVAISLYSKNEFQGVLWLGHRQPRPLGDSELGLLRSLANQASMLIVKANLFATADGQRRRLAAVLSSTSDPVLVTDQTNRILLLNPAMERLFNVSASDVANRLVADVIPSQGLVAALTEQEERVRNLEIAGYDGRTFYAGVSTIIRNDGQVVGRVAVLHDITKLKELDRLKSEFVSTVSHDLRGPLTFMRGYITMLGAVGEVNERQRAYIEKIEAGVQQMSRLVEDLLDLGRIEAGVELMRNVIEIQPLLAGVVEELADQATEVGIDLQILASPDLPVVTGDASLIRRAVANLVSNAIKYAPNSGVVLVRAQHDGDEIIISVHDRGPGIAPADQIRLWEKFYRVKKRDQDSGKSSGLGLAIVKSIVERHGGRVWLHSQEGRGSSFYFSLPIKGLPEEED